MDESILTWPKSYKLNDWGITISADVKKLLHWQDGDELNLSLNVTTGELTLKKIRGEKK